MISAPIPMTSRGVIALTEPYVPTGMNAGVSTVPRAKVRRPRRPSPSVAWIANWREVIRPLSRVWSGPAQTVYRSRAPRQDQHRVAIREEAVVLFDRMPVGVEDRLAPGQCRHQHQQG